MIHTHTRPQKHALLRQMIRDDRLPYSLLLALTLLFIVLTPFNDHSRVFIPAGQLILQGQNPYPLDTGYFLYWPFSFWFFPLLALHPLEYYLLYWVNVVLLIVITRRLKISGWWCLYPPALFTIIYGQIDIIILLMTVEAYRRRQSLIAIVLIAAAASIKPQTAIFWSLPWWWALGSFRLRFRYALAVGGILLVPMLCAWLLSPDLIVRLWQDWAGLARQTSDVYVNNSLSLWSLGLVVPAIFLLGLSLFFTGNHQVSRPLMALGMPAMGYYSSVVLAGVIPAWGILIAYGTITLTMLTHRDFFWIEPLVILAYHLWQGRQQKAPIARPVSVILENP